MPHDHRSAPAAPDTAISRRTLLRSGAGAIAVAYSLDAVAGSRARADGSGIDEHAIRNLFAETAKSLIVPGAVMIVRAPGVKISAAYGSTTLGGHRRPDGRDHVRIGSVTKTFTGTVILQAIQRGDLKLDDPVARYQPKVPNGNRITIEQLLTMHSGLYNYSLYRPLSKVLDKDPGHVFTPQQLLDVAYQVRPDPHPGGAWDYCNTNTVLLGLIAEQIFQRPLAQIFERRLFHRLGMHSSSFPALRTATLPRPHPRGYMFGTNVSTLKTAKLPPKQIAAAEAGRLKPGDYTFENPSWGWAAGAGISTAEDVARWVKGLCDGSLLNRRWQRQRLDSVRSVNPSDPAASGYGLAIAKYGPLYGHAGELPGFQTFAGYDPERKLTLVVCTNLTASPRGLACADTIAARVAEKLY